MNRIGGTEAFALLRGENGIRANLEILCPKGLEGSIPSEPKGSVRKLIMSTF